MKQDLPGFVYLPRNAMCTKGTYFRLRDIEQVSHKSVTISGIYYTIQLTKEKIVQAMIDTINISVVPSQFFPNNDYFCETCGESSIVCQCLKGMD